MTDLTSVVTKKKLGGNRKCIAAAPTGDLSRAEIREIDPRSLTALDENERQLLSVREISKLLNIKKVDDIRKFDGGFLDIPADIRELTDDKEILGRDKINEKWEALVGLAQSMFSDYMSGQKPGGILEVMKKDFDGADELVILKGHRRQLAAIIADITVWVEVREYITSPLERVKQRAHENLQRDDLTLIEMIDLYLNILAALKDDGLKPSQVEAQKILHKSKSWVSCIHRVATNDLLREATRAGKINSFNHAAQIVSLPIVEQKIALECDVSQESEKDVVDVKKERKTKQTFKLASTKNKDFFVRLIRAALKDKEIKKHKNIILAGIDLNTAEEDELSLIWKQIIQMANQTII